MQGKADMKYEPGRGVRGGECGGRGGGGRGRARRIEYKEENGYG